MSACKYLPKPIDSESIELGADLVSLTERLAENAHELWAEERLKQGWKHGPERSDSRKEHPGLVGYGELTESEKDLDRKAAMGTIKAILALGGVIGVTAVPALRSTQYPAGWIDYLEQTFKTGGDVGPHFDMDDKTEIATLRGAGAKTAADALDYLNGQLKDEWILADDQAMQQQKRHRRIAALAIWPGISAIMLAILQLALRSLQIAPRLVEVIANLETLAVLVALSSVIWGLYAHFHHGWLASRQRAERLRILKFQSLSWPNLWCRFEEWKQQVAGKIEQLKSLTPKEAHAWANRQDQVLPELLPAPDCVVPPLDVLALAAYYRVKRLKFQRAYFTRQSLRANRQSWIAKYKLSLVFFLLSVAAVGVHNILHRSHRTTPLEAAAVVRSGTNNSPSGGNVESANAHLPAPAPDRWEVAAISLAALLPVLGFGFRAWLAAFEATRSRNLYTAKAHAIEGYLERSEVDSASVQKILHHIAHGEHFLAGEHREWCRLQLEAEWFA